MRPPSRTKPPRTGPKQRAPRQRRAVITADAIIDAAAVVLASDGATGLSTNRVAEVAGVSVGSVYQYFPNKEAIVCALIERYALQFRAAFRAVVSAAHAWPLPLLLATIADRVVDVFWQQRRVHATLAIQMSPLGMRRQLERLFALYVDDIEQVLRSRPEVRVRDPRLAAFVAFHAVDGVINAIVSSETQASAAAAGRELARMVAGYLTYDPELP